MDITYHPGDISSQFVRRPVSDENENLKPAIAITNELDILINTSVRYVVMQQNNHHRIALIDIQKFSTENHTVSRPEMDLIMIETKKRLESRFGLKMVEMSSGLYIVYTLFNLGEILMDLNEERFATYLNDLGIFDYTLIEPVQFKNADQDQPVFENNVDCEDSIFTYDEMIEHSKRTLLMTILSLIYMNQFSLTEADLFLLLQEFGLSEDCKIFICHDISAIHNKFTVKDLISKEFTRHNYLKRVKVKSFDQNIESHWVYHWGQRSHLEFKKTDILRFVMEIYGERDNFFWVQMYRHAIKEDKIREEIVAESFDNSPNDGNNCDMIVTESVKETMKPMVTRRTSARIAGGVRRPERFYQSEKAMVTKGRKSEIDLETTVDRPTQVGTSVRKQQSKSISMNRSASKNKKSSVKKRNKSAAKEIQKKSINLEKKLRKNSKQTKLPSEIKTKKSRKAKLRN